MPIPNDPARPNNRPIWVFMAATAMATTVSTLAATAMVKAESTEPVSVHCTCETPAAIAVAPPQAPAIVTPTAPTTTTTLPTPSASPKPNEATVEGPLDKSIIRRIVRAHINEVRYCYNQGLAQDPELSGRVEVSFTIGAEGKITSSEIAATTLEDSEVPQCIADAVGRWMFPKSPNAKSVHVTYPFVLDPG